MLVSFESEHEFAIHDHSSSGSITRHQLKDLEVSDRVQLLPAGSEPFRSIQRCQCFIQRTRLLWTAGNVDICRKAPFESIAVELFEDISSLSFGKFVGSLA
jgi:hypothetical protein